MHCSLVVDPNITYFASLLFICCCDSIQRIIDISFIILTSLFKCKTWHIGLLYLLCLPNLVCRCIFFSFFKPHLALITLLIKSKSWLGFWHYLKYLSAAFAMTTYLIRIILRTMYILQPKKWTIKLQLILEVYFVKHNIFFVFEYL